MQLKLRVSAAVLQVTTQGCNMRPETDVWRTPLYEQEKRAIRKCRGSGDVNKGGVRGLQLFRRRVEARDRRQRSAGGARVLAHRSMVEERVCETTEGVAAGFGRGGLGAP